VVLVEMPAAAVVLVVIAQRVHFQSAQVLQ
jgi:hypothetical protein